MDTRWSKAIGAAQVDPRNPNAALIGLAEVQRQFITNLEFTAGMATKYCTGPLTGDDTHLHLAAGYEPGRRFHAAEVIRLADAKKVHLGHVHRADARWRLYAFADAVDPAQPRLPAEQADGLPRRSELARGEVHPRGVGRRLGLRRARRRAATAPLNLRHLRDHPLRRAADDARR